MGCDRRAGNLRFRFHERQEWLGDHHDSSGGGGLLGGNCPAKHHWDPRDRKLIGSWAALCWWRLYRSFQVSIIPQTVIPTIAGRLFDLFGCFEFWADSEVCFRYTFGDGPTDHRRMRWILWTVEASSLSLSCAIGACRLLAHKKRFVEKGVGIDSETGWQCGLGKCLLKGFIWQLETRITHFNFLSNKATVISSYCV